MTHPFEESDDDEVDWDIPRPLYITDADEQSRPKKIATVDAARAQAIHDLFETNTGRAYSIEKTKKKFSWLLKPVK